MVLARHDVVYAGFAMLLTFNLSVEKMKKNPGIGKDNTAFLRAIS